MEKRPFLRQMVSGKLDSSMQRNEAGLLSYTRHKNKFKMDERHECETRNYQKILEENTGSNLFDLGHSTFSLDTLLEARETKANMNYWDLIRIKSFCMVKETTNKTKRQPME